MNIDKPKILFVLLDNYKSERLGIQILAAIALEEGYDRELIILNKISNSSALEKAQRFQPHVVAYSAMTFEQIHLQAYNRRLKESGLRFLSIFGGHHYTFNPEEIEKDTGIDVICRGEGEIAFRSFLQAVRNNQQYHQIPNLWVRNDNKIIKNPLGALIHNLDESPFPDRDLLPPIYIFEKSQIYGKSTTIMFGRGCPYQCTYCFNSSWNSLYKNDRILRCRSVDNMIRELKLLADRFDPELFYFWDDDFSLLPKKTIAEFCRRYKKEIKRPFSIHLNAARVDEDLIKLLKETGLSIATMSIECGDEHVAHTLLKRDFNNNKKIIEGFQLLNRYNIINYSQNILCLPVENPLEVDLTTIRMNIRCKPTVAHYFILLPFPKTPIWRYAIEHGYLYPDALLDPKKIPSAYTTSFLNYRNSTIQNRANNLHKFASLLTKFPVLFPLVKILIKLPPNRLFQYIFFIWYGYCNAGGLFHTRITPKLIIEGLRGIRQYLRGRSAEN
ncbi:MAG: radical SAM protein [Candidatus Euphemobacter frigidus]|nr:radical SAM protein [Candidatus Euphemobacter frigidus]